MTLDAGRGILYSALKTVQAKWDGVESHWDDQVRQRFVEQVWEPLQRQTAETLEAIDQLQTLLVRMRHECEGTEYDLHSSH